MSEPAWLLFIYSIPPKPDYLRVKVRRRLQQIGAAPLKNSVYVRTNDRDALEDFGWLAREIEADGGSAVICATAFLDGITDVEVKRLLKGEKVPAPPKRRAPGPDAVEPGRRWVTRKNVFVDRIASAWLIRRWIDPKATFKFVAARGYRPRAGELRFDMLDGEYTHVGSACTFEVLLDRFALADRGLTVIAQIVHDIDCKDAKFGRPETAGIALLLRGITGSHPSDRARLEHGAALLDGVYQEVMRLGKGERR
jgi:hypothetical protein